MSARQPRVPVLVAAPCGCEYLSGTVAVARGPVRACDAHRYMRCGKCRGRGEITPFGLWCPHCTFGGDIIPFEGSPP